MIVVIYINFFEITGVIKFSCTIKTNAFQLHRCLFNIIFYYLLPRETPRSAKPPHYARNMYIKNQLCLYHTIKAYFMCIATSNWIKYFGSTLPCLNIDLLWSIFSIHYITYVFYTYIHIYVHVCTMGTTTWKETGN